MSADAITQSLGRTDPQPDAYRDAAQAHDYTFDSGFLYLPVASSSPTIPVRVQLHGGFGMRKIKWRSVRLNAPPVMPSYVLDRAIDYDTQAALDAATEDESADPDAKIRPVDRIVSASTVVAMPLLDPVKGSYTFAAQGEITMCQVFADGPRVVGVDALPTGGRPFDLGRIDDAANEQFIDYDPDDASTKRQSQQVAEFLNGKDDLMTRTAGWPCTIYPPIFTHNQLFQE